MSLSLNVLMFLYRVFVCVVHVFCTVQNLFEKATHRGVRTAYCQLKTEVKELETSGDLIVLRLHLFNTCTAL